MTKEEYWAIVNKKYSEVAQKRNRRINGSVL